MTFVKLKLQYFGHLMRRADSLEKTLMLGKIEGIQGYLPDPGIELGSPALQADSLPAELPGKDWREAAFNPVVIRPGPQ